MKCSKTPALMSGRCAIESNEEAGEVRIGAARWSTVTWWQFEQATVAKSRPLRAVSAEFTICAQAGPAIAKMESVASNAKAHSIARAFVWNGWIIVSPWVRSLRKINAHGRSRISYLNTTIAVSLFRITKGYASGARPRGSDFGGDHSGAGALGRARERPHQTINGPASSATPCCHGRLRRRTARPGRPRSAY
jgi:hypothetical protein